MPSVREEALEALFGVIRTAVPNATVRRNETAGLETGTHGAVVLRDGDPGEPEATLSPPRFWFFHRTEILILVEGETGPIRSRATDDIVQAIDAAIAADPTLKGKAEDAETQPVTSEDGGEGMPQRGVILPVVIEYESTSRAG